MFGIENYSQGRPASRNLDLYHVTPALEQTTPCNQYRHLFFGIHILNTEQVKDDMKLDIVCQLEVVALQAEYLVLSPRDWISTVREAQRYFFAAAATRPLKTGLEIGALTV